MLIEATGKPIVYRWPGGEVRLEPGKPVDLPQDRAAKILAKAPGRVKAVEPSPPAAPAPESLVVDTENDVHGSLVAVKIGGSVIGEFWFCLSDTEPFDLGNGLPVYRPAEIKALKGKRYGPEDLMAVHRAKVALEGRIIR